MIKLFYSLLISETFDSFRCRITEQFRDVLTGEQCRFSSIGGKHYNMELFAEFSLHETEIGTRIHI